MTVASRILRVVVVYVGLRLALRLALCRPCRQSQLPVVDDEVLAVAPEYILQT